MKDELTDVGLQESTPNPGPFSIMFRTAVRRSVSGNKVVVRLSSYLRLGGVYIPDAVSNAVNCSET